MNAIEHGSHEDPTMPSDVEALGTGTDLVVRISDRGMTWAGEVEEPDLAQKLAGAQGPRGWGLFLVRHMVDAMEITSRETGHTLAMTLHLRGVPDDGQIIQR